jgi:hypothetical protein
MNDARRGRRADILDVARVNRPALVRCRELISTLLPGPPLVMDDQTLADVGRERIEYNDRFWRER